MFNPADLPISVGGVPVDGVRGEWAFVGVRRNTTGEMEFCIPIGFENFPTQDSAAKNRLFFDLYKVFAVLQTRRERHPSAKPKIVEAVVLFSKIVFLS